jgi:hypothetical protein
VLSHTLLEAAKLCLSVGVRAILAALGEIANIVSIGPTLSLDFSNLPPIGLLSEVLAA